MQGKAASAKQISAGSPKTDSPGKQRARLEGLEPPTRCLEGSCSIHLSYRRVEAAEENRGERI